jgi:hypothetical protein
MGAVYERRLYLLVWFVFVFMQKKRAINIIRMALYISVFSLSKSLQIDLQPSICNNMKQLYKSFPFIQQNLTFFIY